MSVRRENTFRIDYANVPKKPSFEELHEFVGTVLGLQYEQVLRLQPSKVLGCAFVKVVDLELAQKIVAEHDKKHETEVDGKIYKLRITLEDGAVEVKLSDLSEDITNEQIAEYLSDYGEVLSITDHVWDSKFRFGGCSTGSKIVRMMVKRNIESYITIDGQTTSVTYFGQLQTCRHCSEYIHNGISCVQNKKLLVQKTYANVTKQAGPKSIVMKPSATSQKTPIARLIGPKSGEIEKNHQQQKTNPPVQKPGTTNTPTAPKLPIFNTKLSVPSPTELKHAKTNHPDQPVTLMAPPATTASTSRMITRQTNASDGNDTDCSSASGSSKRRSGRPPGKKPRQNNGDDEQIEEIDTGI